MSTQTLSHCCRQRLQLHMASLLCIAGLVVSGCGSSSVLIRPSVTRYGDAPSQPLADSYCVLQVTDKRGYADPANVGFTQTGMFNKQTPLLSEPPPTVLVKNALAGALQNCNALARDSAQATYGIRVALTQFQLTEVTGFISESIEAKLGYEVTVVDPRDGSTVGRYSVESSSKSGGGDTTGSAEKVARSALELSLPSFLKQLAELKPRGGS